MNKIYVFILLCVCFSCNKEHPKNLVVFEKKTPKVIIKVHPEGIAIKIDSSLVSSFNSKVLTDFYKASNYETVWQSDKNRKIVINQITKSEENGLNSNDYHIDKLTALEKNHATLNKNELIDYDILLTHNFQKHLIHLNNGKLNPKTLYTDWDLEETHFDVNTYLYEGFANNSFKEIIEKCKPNSITYKKLIKALELISNYPKDRIKVIETTDKLTLNDTNIALINIKKRLRYWNDLAGKDSVTSIYNKKTFDAVKRFQKRHGLAADGVIGVGTLAALNFTRIQRKQQIISNLERLRWYNREFSENYVIINIPDYSLNVVENKDTIIVRKVVVGTIKRKTPILTSTLQTVVLNPTWTVPPTILKEDVVPAMKLNRNYLKNKGITIYDSNNNIVLPSQWNSHKPKSYRYIQSPGIDNSLGVMKILFPNNHSVYLHDTNHRNLFGMHNRSLSSGCVRVENPLELAQHLLNDPENWSKEKIDSVIITKKTKNIKITKDYSIYLWYWTAWSEKEKLIFRNDIYALDADLYSKLRN